MLRSLSPWFNIILLKGLSIQFKEDFPIPDSILPIVSGTSTYENKIREMWEFVLLFQNEQSIKSFIADLKAYSLQYWPEFMQELLDVGDLPETHRKILEKELTDHHKYIDKSLAPDLLQAVLQEKPLENFSYRTIFLYSGAIWSFGSLASVMFDGLNVRDLADIFLFAGPEDDNNCVGERGCKQYVGEFYTVAEILARGIIPGRLQCLTSCRHMLIPIVSPLKEGRKHLLGRHEQKTHGRRGGLSALSSEFKDKLSGGTTEERLLSVFERDNVDANEFLSAYEYTDKTGMKAHISAISEFDDKVTINGKIVDENGVKVGGFTRKFGRTFGGKERQHVIHSSFHVVGGKQKSGFGSRFFFNSEDKYKKAGVKSISLEANENVGGYAWARMGFSANKGDREKLAKRLTDGIEKEYGTKVDTSDFQMWDIAAYSGPDGRRLGKEILLDSSWNGVKFLDNSDEGFKVGQAYRKTK